MALRTLMALACLMLLSTDALLLSAPRAALLLSAPRARPAVMMPKKVVKVHHASLTRMLAATCHTTLALP